jgi:Trp operon repressor
MSLNEEEDILEFYLWISNKANQNNIEEEIEELKKEEKELKEKELFKKKYKSLSKEEQIEKNNLIEEFNYKSKQLQEKIDKPSFYKIFFDLLDKRKSHFVLLEKLYKLYKDIVSYDEDLKISLLDIYEKLENKNEIYKVIENINKFYSKLDNINSFLYIYHSIENMYPSIKHQFKDDIQAFINSIIFIKDEITFIFSNFTDDNVNDLLNELDDMNKEIDPLLKTVDDNILLFFHLWFYMKLILNYNEKVDELFKSWKGKNMNKDTLFDDKFNLNTIFYDFEVSTDKKHQKVNPDTKLSDESLKFLKTNVDITQLFKDTKDDPSLVELENRLKELSNSVTENSFIDTLKNNNIRCPRELPVYCISKQICVRNSYNCDKNFYKTTIANLNVLSKKLDNLKNPYDRKRILEQIRDIKKVMYLLNTNTNTNINTKSDNSKLKEISLINDFEGKIKTFMVLTLHLPEEESNQVYKNVLQKKFGESIKLLVIDDFSKICKILMLMKIENNITDIKRFNELYGKSKDEIDKLFSQKEGAVRIIQKLARKRQANKEIENRNATKIQSLIRGRQTRKKLSQEADKFLQEEIDYKNLVERLNKLKVKEAGNNKKEFEEVKTEIEELEDLLKNYSDVEPSNQTAEQLLQDIDNMIRKAEDKIKRASLEDFIIRKDGRKRKKSIKMIKKKYNSKSKKIRKSKKHSDGKKKYNSKSKKIRKSKKHSDGKKKRKSKRSIRRRK